MGVVYYPFNGEPPISWLIVFEAILL